MMDHDELVNLAQMTAAANELEPAVVCGICEQESSWYTYSIRFEPDFYVVYVGPLVKRLNLSQTEAEARAFSWGLGQVMGQTARELGFNGVSLAELLDPEIGVKWLCKVFAHKLKLAEGNVNQALELYNGGKNTLYSAQVMDKSRRYR